MHFRPRRKFNEIRARLFFMREDFYETYKAPKTLKFFRNEWNIFYFFAMFNTTKFISLIRTPLEFLYVYYYARSQHLQKTFNTHNRDGYNKNTSKAYTNLYWGFISF